MGRIQKRIAAIVAERNALGELSQRELAKALGCSQPTVSHLLTGSRTLSEKWIEQLCDILGITLADLENPEPPLVEPKPLRDIHRKLKRLYEIEPGPAFKSLNGVVDLCVEGAEARQKAAQKPEGKVVVGDFTKPSEVTELPAIDYSDPKHQHDAPREEIYEDLPFYDEFRVPAGRPDHVTSDGTMSVRKVVRHLAKGNRYVIRVTGDSMEPRIQDGDLILVDHSKEPRPGNIVIALINGAAVVKKYLRQKGRVILRSTNPKYTDIEIAETDQFIIAGVVLRIVEGAV